MTSLSFSYGPAYTYYNKADVLLRNHRLVDCLDYPICDNEHIYANRNTREVRNLLGQWIQFSDADPYQFTGDQVHLDELIKKNKTIVFEELPWEYSYFPGIMTTENGPVILQHQASIHGRKEFKNCPHCQKGPYGSVTI